MPLSRPRLLTTGAVLAVLAVAALAAQQDGFFGGFQGFGRLPEGPGVPIRYPPSHFEDGAFTICKLQYSSDRYEQMGVGWSTDYPYAGINLMTRLSELTKTPISRDHNGNPNYWVVRPTDDDIFRCPFVIASDVGTMGLDPPEVANLRKFLLKGGFLWVDDFWGDAAWNHWVENISMVLPEFEIIDVPQDHPIRHQMFNIHDVKQVTNINFWRRSGGDTRERGEESPHADFRIIADQKGRVMVVMTHNTDEGDSWEREGEDHEFFLQFSPDGYALGVNILLYAMTH